MDQYWLTVIIVLLIIGIVYDGVRRMRKARHDSIKMALKPVKKKQEESGTEVSDSFGSEFPNGGARASNRRIDPDRIKQVRNKYNFGTDMSAWRDKVAEKIAEHTGIHKTVNDTGDKKAPRIEPSLEGADPLLDNVNELDYTDSGDTDYVEESVIEEYEAEAYSQQDELVALADDVDDEIEIVESGKEQKIESQKTASSEPIQVSLNLEDSVPMLMDSLDEDGPVDDDLDKTEMIDVTSTEDQDGDVAVAESEKIVPVASHIEPVDEEEGVLESHSANKPRYESKYTDHAKHQVAAPQEVLVIHVRAAENEYFYGNDLLELILENGLRFGDMDIFHRHAGEDGEGPILFSMANMVKPGVFDLHNFEEFSTVGVSFFLGLPTETGADMDAFNTMLATAKDIAEKLQGELKDENRSVLTKQTIEHYRERIRDFARRQQLEKNKP